MIFFLNFCFNYAVLFDKWESNDLFGWIKGNLILLQKNNLAQI